MGSGSIGVGNLNSKAETLITSVALGMLPWGNLSIPVPLRGRWKSRISISWGPSRIDRHIVKEEDGYLYLRKGSLWEPSPMRHYIVYMPGVGYFSACQRLTYTPVHSFVYIYAIISLQGCTKFVYTFLWIPGTCSVKDWYCLSMLLNG